MSTPGKSASTLTAGVIIAGAIAVIGITATHVLVGDPADPREWFDWAFAHGTPGLLALISIVQSFVNIKLYRENGRLHHEKEEVISSHAQELARQALEARDREAGKDARCQQELMDLEREMRDEQKGLFREQVKLAGVNSRVIAENRGALDNLSLQLERNNKLLEYFIDQDSAADNAPSNPQP